MTVPFVTEHQKKWLTNWLQEYPAAYCTMLIPLPITVTNFVSSEYVQRNRTVGTQRGASGNAQSTAGQVRVCTESDLAPTPLHWTGASPAPDLQSKPRKRIVLFSLLIANVVISGPSVVLTLISASYTPGGRSLPKQIAMSLACTVEVCKPSRATQAQKIKSW